MCLIEAPKSLFELCSEEVAQLACVGYWKGKERPFVCLSSNVIEKVYERISRLWFRSKNISSADLQPLISSGHMRKLNLILLREHISEECEPLLNITEEIKDIFMQLSLECRHLESLIIMLEIDDEFDIDLGVITPVLNSVLKNAHNLKHLASNIEFDLRVLCNCPQLEELIIHFPLFLPICEFLRYNDEFRPHKNLKKYFISQPKKPDEEDISIVLKYCSNLRYINIDISKSLELLHTPEYLFGTYSRQYNIEKLYLYLEWDFIKDDITSPIGFKIVTETCPNINMLCVVTDSIKTIPQLKVFCNIRALSIEMIYMSNTDFSEGILPLFEPPGIGHNLTVLDLRGFTNIDFSSLAASCPSLRILNLLFQTDKTRDLPPNAFQKLLTLSVENIDERESDNKSLFKILYHAPNLESLVIFNRFTDYMLEDVLSRNKLSKLKKLHILDCALSLAGVEMLVESLRSLIDLRVNHTFEAYEIEDEILDIVNESGSDINITFEDLPRYWESDYANIEYADVEYSNPDDRFMAASSLYYNTFFL